jgi:hypothetical protein
MTEPVTAGPGGLGLVLRHVALPAVAPAALVALSFMPLTVVDCCDRGLLALAVTLASAAAAFVCVVMAFRGRARSRTAAGWWTLSAAILTVPLALLVGPLG